MSGRGRPFGHSGYCSFCAEYGHTARGGTCSRAAVAERLLSSGELSGADVADIVGCTRQNVSQRRITAQTRPSVPPPGTMVNRTTISTTLDGSDALALAEAAEAVGETKCAFVRRVVLAALGRSAL